MASQRAIAACKAASISPGVIANSTLLLISIFLIITEGRGVRRQGRGGRQGRQGRIITVNCQPITHYQLPITTGHR
ncbi:hypothetical protein IQ272_24670 [Chroococcidiopsidales cyanobacterium LEGE 13417]|uniref:hypothetical protein n=1 Tax=Chroococcidiopsis sp. CCALA 051 TaxID=869949 RepID=UPI0018EB79E2|nr:hypothetical protein [Chroococcidiopsis sp. CCALA 051]MBE9019268.1 hypothetical protein [Chroococcidiopsidales cyanobacterium LEGE 13417]